MFLFCIGVYSTPTGYRIIGASNFILQNAYLKPVRWNDRYKAVITLVGGTGMVIKNSTIISADNYDGIRFIAK